MNFYQLEYFCVVCRTNSISRASEELYVSQPAISVAIRELEKEFNVPLFYHRKNRISLTSDGEKFYLKASEILRQKEELATEFSSLGQNVRPVRIGIPPILSTVFFPKLLEDFKSKCDIPVQLFEYGSERAMSLVESNDLDCAIVNMDHYNDGKLNSAVILSDLITFCVSSRHPFCGRKSVKLEELKGERLVFFNTDSVMNRTITNRFRSLGINPQTVMYSSQLLTILNFIENENCGAFLFSSVPVEENKFAKIPLEPEITSSSGLVWRYGAQEARVVKFIDFVKESGIKMN